MHAENITKNLLKIFRILLDKLLFVWYNSIVNKTSAHTSTNNNASGGFKMKEKLYPFSVVKHAHDIEFYHNRLYNTMRNMESGEIPMDKKRYNSICNLYYGELQELYEMMFNSRDGRIVYLTGKQIGLAKKIVEWASNTRYNTQIAHGKYRNLQYC